MRYILALLLALFVGCQFAPFVSPIIQLGIYWVEGEAHKYYYNDEKTIESGLRAVLRDMELPIVKDYEQDGVRYIVANNVLDHKNKRDRQQDSFSIKIDPIRHNVTQLSIRIDFMGNKPYAELIYREVDKQAGVKVFQTSAELKGALECAE